MKEADSRAANGRTPKVNVLNGGDGGLFWGHYIVVGISLCESPLRIYPVV
jgi:hypothetical protein